MCLLYKADSPPLHLAYRKTAGGFCFSGAAAGSSLPKAFLRIFARQRSSPKKERRKCLRRSLSLLRPSGDRRRGPSGRETVGVSAREAAKKPAEDFEAQTEKAPAKRHRFQEQAEQEKLCLRDHLHLPEERRTAYAPKTPDEGPADRSVEALLTFDCICRILNAAFRFSHRYETAPIRMVLPSRKSPAAVRGAASPRTVQHIRRKQKRRGRAAAPSSRTADEKRPLPLSGGRGPFTAYSPSHRPSIHSRL